MKSNEALAAEMQKNMTEARAAQEWREVLIDIRRELPEDIKDVEAINTGIEPAKGFKREKMSGREREKKRCEDRKIKDPEHGLFMIADGVSTGEGSTAAELTSRFVQGRLGEALDKKLANLKASGKATTEMINDFIAAEFQKTVHEADAAVKRIQQTDPEYKSTNSTLSLAKLVEMPGGGQRLYFANLGDSRIQLKRGERLMRLTRDDSMPQMRVEAALARKNMTLEEAMEIDQVMDFQDFTPAQKEVYKGTAAITAYIGGSEKAANLPYVPEVAGLAFHEEPSEEAFWEVNNEESGVRWIDVRPGDKLVITSDGPHDNLTERQMNNLLDRFPGDEAAEQAIQGTAVNMMRADQDRSKPDDASIVVHEIGESRPESFEPDRAPAEARPYTHEERARWPEQIQNIDRLLLDARRQIVQKEKMGASESDINLAEQALVGLEERRAKLEYWIARGAADQVKDELPHRFEPGHAVDMSALGGGDSRNWEIRAYDIGTEEYVVAQPNKPAKRVSRLELENAQSDVKLKFGDVLSLPVTGPDGRAQLEGGFEVKGYRDDGKVVFERKSAEGVDRFVLSEEAATDRLRETIHEGVRWEREAAAKLAEVQSFEANKRQLQAENDRLRQAEVRQQIADRFE